MCVRLLSFGLLLIALGFARWAHAQATAALTGRVVDAATRQPVASAQMVITAASRMVLTAANGTFVLRGLAAGTHSVAVRRIGYEPRQDTVQLRAGESRQIEIVLAPRPVPLPEVAVAAERGYLGGFWERRANSQGHFITRDDILRRNPPNLAEMFYGVAGAKVVPSGWGKMVASTRGSRTFNPMTPGRECIAAVFLDGAPYAMSAVGLNEILLDHVEAMEYYSSPARIPAQFDVTGTPMLPSGNILGDPRCGVLAIWTRGGQ